jgi:hypothetical protein
MRGATGLAISIVAGQNDRGGEFLPGRDLPRCGLSTHDWTGTTGKCSFFFLFQNSPPLKSQVLVIPGQMAFGMGKTRDVGRRPQIMSANCDLNDPTGWACHRT